MGLRIAAVLAVLLGVGLFGGAAHSSAALEIEAVVSPSSIYLNSATPWLTVHTDIAYRIVARDTLELNGLPVAWTTVDNHGHLVAKFHMGEVKEIVAPPATALTLSGYTNDGVYFAGTDVVEVKGGGK